MTNDILADLKARVIAANKACETLDGDIRLLKASIDGHVVESAKLDRIVRQLLHDHQSTRNIVVNLLDELERLVPA